jgi:Na+-transporting methylmalonyl-CoA/oxaloacetate decarboxylase beta subunit
VDFGFGDRIFVSVMITFGLGFLWLGWLEKYLPIWIVPLIGLGFALLLIIPWYRKFNRERIREKEELLQMRNGIVKRMES